ncbi:hypothetical protein ABB37_07040 [Leptomonas pyrrhocoris]|uniref:J domain-containing protein n=1 Tax=Leptomonas pyrrhocoris TaxID=157538 RepID=A0A0M9FX21_LEPPY|nr:hypothetical protein ABB37_07040 [Leptomonas pyrrhocoris]KPA77719.1 hypothetical protein ABB37_07040 [Leptomonas pyrrhocoris]|eukprot:XP_015656158.1 hypothetical protein ABB37_07040 [Leptomonas pyrrhocoris]
MNERDVARFILSSASDRDVLGLCQYGPLTREAIQKAFHDRALHIHPDKAKADASPVASSVVDAAFGKLIEARDRLVELLPHSQTFWKLQQPSALRLSDDAQVVGSAPFHYTMPPSSFTAEHASASLNCESTTTSTSPSLFTSGQTEDAFFSFSASKCHTLGCLRLLSAEDVQAHQIWCAHCRAKPRKCVVFGCLRMVTGAECCSEHRL